MGLGGNTDQTLGAFSQARAFLAVLLEDARFSLLYRTEPQLDTDQEPFWNAVASGLWPGSAEGLLERLLMFEVGRGRVRDPLRPKGPRVLDLDLLVFGSTVKVSPRLTIPHPGLASRRFALVPLVEVEPSAVDPRDAVPWAVKCELLADQGVDRSGRTW